MDSVSDIAGVNPDSRNKRWRRRRKKKNSEANDTHLLHNVNQANPNVECSTDENILMTTRGRIQGNVMEVDSAVELTAEHQKSVIPLEVPVETLESAKEPRRGRVIKKADGTEGSLGIDHSDIMSNLSLVDACDGLTDDKSKKILDIPKDFEFSARKDSPICTSKCVNGAEYPSEVMSSDVSTGPYDLLAVPRLFAKRSPVVCARRKLLILDINGLLADIVMPPPRNCKADGVIAGRAIFKRPFYYDFLKFCNERFDVGIWSSRSKKIVDKVVDYLFGDLKQKLLFCWDMFQCTETGFKTLENRHKPLVCKELRKLWEKHYPDLPWEKGDYDESNTLLLDDSPYKALLNPIHTAIFPYSYQFGDKSDNSLGPGGDLRVYLEGLAATDNVQKYIEQHPFGQGAIDETSSLWGFYSKVLSQSVRHTERC